MVNVKKLAIGTANFGQVYNGVRVPPDEQRKIWDYCREVGIDMVDTAVAYGKIDMPKDFKVVTKITQGHTGIGYYGLLLHHIEDYNSLWPRLKLYKKQGYVEKIGISIDAIHKIPDEPIDIIQLPYLKTLAWYLPTLQILKSRNIEIHVRKVFADNCYKEAMADPNVDRVIIGIDNLEQLKQNVEG